MMPAPKKKLASATMIGGASPVHKRSASDFYPTPPECTTALLDAYGDLFNGVIWEPACGDGAISKVLALRGISVHSTDLRHTGYGTGGVDALAGWPRGVDAAITNPPFNLAPEFIRVLSTERKPFALLLKSTFWHAVSRFSLFTETAPVAVCPMLWRPNFAPERGSSPTMDVCWTIWGAGPSDRPCEYVPMRKPVTVDQAVR